MFASDPVGLPGLAAFFVGALLFVAAVFAAQTRGLMGGREAGARRAGWSTIGIVVQGLGIGIAGFGPQRVVLDPLGAPALGEAGAVTALMVAAAALFLWASRTMGRNWSIVARTRADHALVRTGPFAHIRHPIYVAMACFMLGLAIASGHVRQLIVAAPLFALGTMLRVRIEERLLRRAFGADYDAYAARVKRFVPGVF